jgi:outer membrane lipoprotein
VKDGKMSNDLRIDGHNLAGIVVDSPITPDRAWWMICLRQKVPEMAKRIAAVLCVGLIALPMGCSGPVISKEIRETSWPISGFAEVRENPEEFKDKTIIVGGTIIDTINDDGSATLIILSYPLDDSEQPAKWENSQGRFMVNTSHFLDPHVYTNERKVTVAGVVIGVKTAPAGRTQYRYVILNAVQLYLWPLWYQRFTFPIYPKFYPRGYSEDAYE